MTQEDITQNSGTTDSPKPAGGRWHKLVKPAAGIAVLLVVILWSVGVFQKRTPPGVVEYLEGIQVPDKADIYTAKEDSIAPRLDVIGTVASRTRADISARIPSYVKDVFVAAGDSVKKGQLLITLDDREIAEQTTAAEAQFKQAETEFNRARQLLDSKATTEQAMTAAQAMFTAARAQLERSRVMMTYAQIASPMDGVVTDCRVVAGDLANPGQVLLAVYDSANMQLEVPVPMRLLNKLPVGQKVEVTLDRVGEPLQGTVSKIVSEVDPLSRTQLVKVSIDAVVPQVLPGTFGRLWVEDAARKTIMVPATAVYQAGQIDLVQVVRNGRAVRRAVRIGLKTGSSMEVLSGIDAGDVVMVNPVKEN